MWISGLQQIYRADILYILEHMKTDRYKTDYLGRSTQHGGIDGLSTPIRRGVSYSVRTRAAAPEASIHHEKAQKITVKVKPAHQANQPQSFEQQSSLRSTERHRAIEQQSAQEYTAIDATGFPLPSYEAPKRPKLVIGRRKKVRRTMTRVAAGLATLVLVTGSILGWRAYASAGKVLSGTTTVAALSSEKVTPSLLKGEGDGRVNILLLGIGGVGHDGGDLTDTMILASVDPVNYQVSLLSIPRDLWVKMPVNYYGTSQKINAAYSAGKYEYLGKTDLQNSDPLAIKAGTESVDTVVGQVLGVDIDYHVLVNFAGFAQAIDTVDGVTVDVKKPLVDASMAWENNNNSTLVPAGQQQMDGKEALLYARSRHSSSDFDRSERQRQLLVALKQKILTLGTFSNPVKLDGLASVFGKNVYSDLSTKAALRLYDIMKKVDDSTVQSLDLVTAPHDFVTTDRVGTISVVRPKLGFETYSDIQAYIRSQLRDGYLVRENAQITVVANTQALATATQTILKNYGYNAKSATVHSSIERTTVVDLSGGKAPYTRNYLEKRYGTNIVNTLPSGTVVPAGTQFAILVSK